MIDGVTNLTAADLKMQFNPTVLQVVDADAGSAGVQIQPGNFPAPDLIVTNIVTNTSGVLQYALVQLPPTEPKNGGGVLATVNFQAIGEGVSPLTFATQLANNDGQEIPARFEFGQIIVTVGGPATVQPTPLQTATLSPTQVPEPSPTFTVAPLTPPPSLATATPLPPPARPTPLPAPIPPPGPVPSPAPLLTQLPPGATLGFCYRVQPGDTLDQLAVLNNTSQQAIQIANDLTPPYYIFEQQALFIPISFGSGPNFYQIQAGDTLTTLAETCHLPVAFIAWVNHIGQNDFLVPGHYIEIPIPPFPPPSRYPHPQAGPYGPPSVFPPTNYGAYPPQKPGRGHYPPPPGEGCDYVVEYGDTLYGIGRRFDVSVESLKQANGLYNADHIYVGQCLTIPPRW
jgi:LysM repeat protein